jgi:hypothetical protein
MLSYDHMAEMVRPHSTISDRIRALDAAGVPRAEIAKFLGKRYQHVRNVLEGDKQRTSYALGHADLSGVHEQGASFERPADDRDFIEPRGDGAYRLVVRPDGSILLPKEVLSAFGAEGGGVVMAKLEGDTFGLISAETAARRIQEIMRRYIRPGDNVVDEFLAERRAEAAREEAHD